MRNKCIKTLSLGICFIMFSAFILVPTLQSNAKIIMPIPTYRTIMSPCQDPPLL